jgi:hypothetical protein
VSSFHVFSVLVACLQVRKGVKIAQSATGSADRLCCSAAVDKCQMVRKGGQRKI